MPAAFIEDYTGTINASGTTISATTTAAVGNVIVVVAATDPRVTAGTATCADASGNTYTQIGIVSSANGGNRIGTMLWMFVCTVTTALTAQSVTVTFSNTTTPKVIRTAVWSGITTTPRNSAVSGGSTTAATTISVTSNSANAGDVVMAGFAAEGGSTFTTTFDSDTTNGTWENGGTTSSGTTATGQVVGFQSKIVTADGTQTWDLTHTSGLRSYIIVPLQAIPEESGVSGSFGIPML